MNEPKRWSERSSGALLEESELLRAGASERMPSELRAQIWSAITLATAGAVAVGTLGAAGVASAAAQTSASSAKSALGATAASKGLALSLGSVVKGVIAVAVLTGVGVGAVHVQRSRSTLASGQPMHSVPARTPAPAAVDNGSVSGSELSHSAASLGPAHPSTSAVASAARPQVSTAAHAPSTVPSPASPSSKAPTVPLPSRAGADDAAGRVNEASARSELSSHLHEESAAVLAIRRTLLAGNAREALALLARARTEFPRGALVEEREALSVRALLGAGETEAARSRGEAFLRRFPRSPHASDVRRWLGMK